MIAPPPDPSAEADREVVSRILAIVAQETAIEPERLRYDARIEELGIASIDLMQAIFALETHFDVEIPLVARDGGAEFATVGDLVSHALAAINSARQGAAA